MALSRPLKENRPASLMQAIDGVISLALCPQIVYEAPQQFNSSLQMAAPFVAEKGESSPKYSHWIAVTSLELPDAG